MNAHTARRADWSQLESATRHPSGKDWRVAKSFVTVAGQDVLLADDPMGLRHLLVPFPEDDAEVQDTRSAGVHLLTRFLEDDGGSHRYLDVACRKVHLTPVFEHLADDVLARLGAGESDVAAVCVTVLGRWRELLTPEVGNVMSQEALAGLFGELQQLREMCLVNPRLATCWTGPRGARHDFTAPGIAIEIKSILARAGWRVRIHGLTQLDARDDETLFLRVFRLEVNGMSGQTVPRLIQDLVDAGVDRLELFQLLTAAGYSASDEEHYRRHRFEVLEQRTEQVRAGTPRMVPTSFTGGQIPAGIEEVQYTVDLAASGNEAMSQQEVIEMLRAFTGRAIDAARA